MGLNTQILAEAKMLPEGTPLSAKSLLHLGTRAAIDQALSRLAKRGELMRAGRGLYVAPVTGKFGKRAPAVETLIEQLAHIGGETIVPSEAASANAFGLTTQVPTRAVYLTSGRTRNLAVGKQTVQLRHASPWKLTLAHEPAGQIVRALGWAGPERANAIAEKIRERVPADELQKVSRHAGRLPSWIATAVGRAARHV
jgi:hypothetical protein